MTIEKLKKFLVDNIPHHMHESILSYLEVGCPTGEFLEFIFCNDFVHAIGKADEYNMDAIVKYAEMLYHHFPGNAWGSPEKVAAWRKTGGLIEIPFQ